MKQCDKCKQMKINSQGGFVKVPNSSRARQWFCDACQQRTGAEALQLPKDAAEKRAQSEKLQAQHEALMSRIQEGEQEFLLQQEMVSDESKKLQSMQASLQALGQEAQAVATDLMLVRAAPVADDEPEPETNPEPEGESAPQGSGPQSGD